ncbi:hypothetical protein EPUS_07371 [Endocarpon pusillum Z07020]|uniref:Uncharacterized protein n=1 Tax=Endocarpon pusillum (strain Z07020 / HMAS-L-300199) TaxID=1263415 RepID=U1HNA8_ENDPU|nr:uncharacterized protein EPUS_07371 [Endocarpon pusillum Z07020]ERF70514.1 hypothetical protein EPUS_07371 [Endocarpon pusillum Z07020]
MSSDSMLASKAGLTCASETLRLELQPLGVDVVTAMVGCINTEFCAKDIPSILPSDSFYRSIERYIEDSAAGKPSPTGMDVNVFAE